MYNKSEFELDSQLIDKLIVVSAGLSGDKELIKQAGIVETLGGIATALKEAVGKRIKEEGTLGAAATYLVPFLLSGPLRWIALLAYWFFDISIGSLINKAFDLAKGVLQETGTFTDADATRVAGEVTAPIVSGASLQPLYELEKNGSLVSAMEGKLVKNAQPSRYRTNTSIWGRLKNIFSSLGRGKSKILGGGLIRWFLSALLMGLSGILAIEGPSMVSQLIGGKAPGQPSAPEAEGDSGSGGGFWGGLLGSGKPQQQRQPARPSYNLPPKIPHQLRPSGRGTQYHINKGDTRWFVRLLNGNIRKTVLSWAVTIYPELMPYVKDILNSQSFNTMVSKLGATYDPVHSSDYLQVLPDSGLHTWQDIVDHFAGEVAKKIKKA